MKGLDLMISRPGMRLVCALVGVLLFLILSLLTIGRSLSSIQECLANLFK